MSRSPEVASLPRRDAAAPHRLDHGDLLVSGDGGHGGGGPWRRGTCRRPAVGVLVYIETEGVFDTTVLFSSEGAKDHRALSVDFTFLFHYC
jgi:hypothetical protein